MKKIYFLPMLMLLASLVFSSSSMAQATRQGNFIIDPYYGGPNFGKNFLNAVEDANNGANDVKATGIGPAGIRLEYMLGDQFGLGVDAIFNSNKISFTDTDTIYDGSGQPTIETYDYEYSMRRLRVHLRFNYHFDITNPQLDAYMGFGAGTNNRFRTTKENGQEIEGDLDDFTLIPFSLRLCAGTRYYFTDNFGLHAELGLGGPVVSAGISVKF